MKHVIIADDLQRREALIADVNRQLTENMQDAIKRLADNPEADLSAIFQTIHWQSLSRATRIREKRRLHGIDCEKYKEGAI